MNWDRDRLLMDLNKFSFRAKPKIKGEISKYYKFYGMRFSSEFEGLDQRAGWVETKDFRIVLQTFIPKNAKATVFIFHGYYDHVGIYQHLIGFLLGSGYAVVIYDMPGHGLSSGTPAAIQSFEQYQDAMSSCLAVCNGHLTRPYHCVGQSTGGAVLIDRLVKKGVENTTFDKVVLLAPLIRPKGWECIGLIHAAIKPFFKIWHRPFSTNSSDLGFVKFLKEHDPLQSKWLAVEWISALKEWVPKIENDHYLQKKILIIQGTSDGTVEWRHNIKVIKRLFREVKIAYIEGGRHHLVNESLDKRSAVFKLLLTEFDEVN
ncbi:MAG: alpha-beta hydrolase superfamily lysophospholipase [Pseudohongiellaceae bacterium]|jgi:alpha-beta hydrolase superfamily lysophospholipase